MELPRVITRVGVEAEENGVEAGLGMVKPAACNYSSETRRSRSDQRHTAPFQLGHRTKRFKREVTRIWKRSTEKVENLITLAG